MTPRIPANEWQAANIPEELPLHIRRNIDPGEGGCWLWRRCRSRDGYGWASLHNKTYQAHRIVYVLLQGDPPSGTVLDHLCRVRHCVNPTHLEAVTPRENLARSELTPAGMKQCRKGHELSPYHGQRRCLTCKTEYERSAWRKRT